MSEEHNHIPLPKRQAAEDRQLLRSLLIKLLDPSARLDSNDRSTLALYLDEEMMDRP